MPSPAPATSATAAGHEPVGTGRLALAFQEILTAIVRLRAGRQPVTDGAAFRAQMTQLLQRADAEARAQPQHRSDIARLIGLIQSHSHAHADNLRHDLIKIALAKGRPDAY